MAGALAIVPGDPRADGVVPAATNRCGGAGVDVEAPTGVAQIGGRASRRPSVTRSRALYDHVLIDNLIATAAPNEDVADWLDLGPTLVVTTEADARAAGYRRSQR